MLVADPLPQINCLNGAKSCKFKQNEHGNALVIQVRDGVYDDLRNLELGSD